MKEFVCVACGYIYNPERGDPLRGVVPGTSWEDVAEEWVCPVCGVNKEQFQEVTD